MIVPQQTDSLIDIAIFSAEAPMSGRRGSNSFSKLGRLEHNPYAYPAKSWSVQPESNWRIFVGNEAGYLYIMDAFV